MNHRKPIVQLMPIAGKNTASEAARAKLFRRLRLQRVINVARCRRNEPSEDAK